MFGTSFIRQKGFMQYDRANDEATETFSLQGSSLRSGWYSFPSTSRTVYSTAFPFFYEAYTTKASLSGALTLGGITSP